MNRRGVFGSAVALCFSLACGLVTPGESRVETTTVAAPEAQPTADEGPADTLSDGTGPTIAGCPVFPADHIWNARVDGLPVHPRSDDYIRSIGRDVDLHPDFGAGLWEGEPIGIPYNVVSSAETPPAAIEFYYPDESDAGPYPIPPDPLIEGGPEGEGDRHILLVDRDLCRLIEIYDAYPQPGGSWEAGSGAVWDLSAYGLRPDGWTSADAAGLPILPGLIRYEDVEAGEIRHALRFTAERTQQAYVWPARHYASDIGNPRVPPMGQRFRLKASFDVSPYPREAQVILRAMQTYGLILADNGGDWFVSGTPDERWDNDMLVEAFSTVQGEDFEAVDTSGLMVDADSGQARP